MKEFILCAAIDFNGVIICGHRHGDCYDILQKLHPVKECDLPDRTHQGFITSENRYVGRHEAWNIAKAANQICYGLKASEAENPEDSILISENLY